MDCSLPGSSVHGIFQARVLEWAAIAFSGTNLRRAETKRKKEFKREAWEEENSNTISFKNNEKMEKYYTNEGTN